MDKAALLAAVMRELESKCAELRRALDMTHEAAVEAPSAMQSHSDTTKFQMNTLAETTKSMLAEAERACAALRNLPPSQLGPCETARVGTVIEISDAATPAARYFLLPEGGGTTVTAEDGRVTVITPQSPVTAALLGAAPGATVTFRAGTHERKMTVTNVW